MNSEIKACVPCDYVGKPTRDGKCPKCGNDSMLTTDQLRDMVWRCQMDGYDLRCGKLKRLANEIEHGRRYCGFCYHSMEAHHTSDTGFENVCHCVGCGYSPCDMFEEWTPEGITADEVERIKQERCASLAAGRPALQPAETGHAAIRSPWALLRAGYARVRRAVGNVLALH